MIAPFSTSRPMANVVPPRRPADDGFAPTSGELLRRARAGDSRALSTLLRRQGMALTRWARGRLPRWARHLADTADLVQDALLNTFRRIDRFDDRGSGALQAYLRQAVQNRISDELRRIDRRPTAEIDDDFPADGLSPYDLTLSAERALRYKQALASLSEADRILIVARFEMDYTSEQPPPAAVRAAP